MDAVLLDRDGVINENRVDHVKGWEEFRFLPNAREAIARLTKAGVRVFIISNQAVINRGIVSQATVDDINARMIAEIEGCGGRVDGVAYCPHRPEESCGCRKPQPGLLFDLARRHNIDLANSALVGDALTDIEAGQAVGCRTILVLTGRGEEQLVKAFIAGKNGFAVVPDLLAATGLLLSPALSVPTPRSLPAQAFEVA